MKMNITEETKEVVRLENVNQFEPRIIRILDKKGVCIAFVIAAENSTSVHINICQEDNIELELEKELV
tara:strand:+ start:240 stop:443 length:204 start_codon:yes stop_codon:yes gene_type:complete